MCCVLAIALVAIAMQESLGQVWCIGLFLCFALCAGVALFQSLIRREVVSTFSTTALVLGIAAFVSLYHSLSQSGARARIQRWEQNVQAIKDSENIETITWNPIVCRASIDESFRYRKTALPGGSLGSGLTGWQSLTVVKVQAIRMAGEWQPKAFQMPLVVDGKVRGYYPGDVIELYGQWRLPTKPSNPGQFDQMRRYVELDYAAQAKAESESQLKRMGQSTSIRLDRILAMISASALDAIEQHVILGQSELTAALVLGQREQAEWRLQEELLATGTIHMLSISGMHIEMVALSLLLIGSFLRIPQKPLLFGVCVIVAGYALLCGSNPPVVRATVMLTGLCVARWNGWSFSSMNMLAFAGVLLILYRTTVVFETGTQLSFMAVAVLILSTNTRLYRLPPIERLIESKSSPSQRMLRRVAVWSREMIRTSFWVWFITAPLVWCSFHVISPIAIVLNLVLWLPMLFALLAGLGLVAFGWFNVLAWPLGWICGFSLWCVQGIVWLGEQVPYGHFWLRAPPSWWLFGFYALGIVFAILRNVQRSSNRRWLVWVLGTWFVFGLMIRPTCDWIERIQSGKSQRMCITFIDVGHGTSILIETPDHQNWLYDAGRMGDHQRSYQVMVDALWAMNKSRIHRLILSHADSDHYNGISGISRRFPINELVTTSQVYDHSSPLLQETLHAVKHQGARLTTWKKGDVHQGNGWNALALHPPAQGVVGTDNANSLCVMLEFAGRRMLIPGDLEPPGMKMLVAQDQTQADILMAPHHGSMKSKSEELLAWCEPSIVVISGSHRAVSQRVLESFRAEGRQVFVTARDHAIRIEISEDGTMQTKHWGDNRWQDL
jgi:competence protein ComEC